MNEFLTIAERDRRYGSAAAFEVYYREEILPFLERDQTRVNQNIDNPPPMVYLIVASDADRIECVIPIFLFSIPEDNTAELMSKLIRYNMSEKFQEYFILHPRARIIAAVGVCYAWMKIEKLRSEEEVKKLPESIKDDPQSEEVVVLMADFCEGEINSAMTIAPDKTCKIVTITERVLITGENRLDRMMKGLFKRTAEYHYKSSNNNNN